MRKGNPGLEGYTQEEQEELTLWNGLFAITPTNTNSVDEITLLGLVSQTTSLVGTRRTGCTVYNVQLTIFPASTSIFTVSLGQANFRLKYAARKSTEIQDKDTYRTRSKKRRTSDCFFL
jgi:hypothetical protein